MARRPIKERKEKIMTSHFSLVKKDVFSGIKKGVAIIRRKTAKRIWVSLLALNLLNFFSLVLIVLINKKAQL